MQVAVDDPALVHIGGRKQEMLGKLVHFALLAHRNRRIIELLDIIGERTLSDPLADQVDGEFVLAVEQHLVGARDIWIILQLDERLQIRRARLYSSSCCSALNSGSIA